MVGAKAGKVMIPDDQDWEPYFKPCHSHILGQKCE
jgi:hypothetical protein